ncbi:hypothetical protein [Dietzia cercidiphylli]|uniref:hypothetical protein n=1 Tax=Dietzia cercidiphylli TaxID=498199 RepID=UPI00223ADC63|nr:hypothetical protein [Dietzia cercidiphylli]MCT1515378.1 hypothetical protein [Dietzia cercidiphylli]
MENDTDPHTVLQAHKLRSSLARAALVNGSTSERAKQRTVMVLVVSVVIALLILAGIFIAEFIIDFIAQRNAARSG